MPIYSILRLDNECFNCTTQKLPRWIAWNFIYLRFSIKYAMIYVMNEIVFLLGALDLPFNKAHHTKIFHDMCQPHIHMIKNVNTLRPRQNGRHFTDDTFKCIFLNENVWISLKISLKFVPKGPINNIPSLVQIMAWRRPGDKPLSEPMLVSLLTHKCVTRPQWAKFDENM